MKGLLKQKNSPKAKKPLLGSKKPNLDDSAAPPKPKKALFGAKNSADKSATQKKPSANKKIDASKLVPIFGGLLVLAALAVAAKMFLFKEEPLPPAQPPAVVQTPPPPPAAPAPAEATEPMLPPTDMASSDPGDQMQPASLAMTPESVPAQNTESVIPADGNAQVAPVDAAVASTQKMTYEEFLQESKNKVYRERETNPASLDAEIAQTATTTGQ